MVEHLKTLAIDFDGVLHRYSNGWQDGSIYDIPMPGAVKAVDILKKRFDLVVFTSRQNLAEVEAWLHDKFNGWMPTVTNRKPIAAAYIDDRALRFFDWENTLDELEKINL